MVERVAEKGAVVRRMVETVAEKEVVVKRMVERVCSVAGEARSPQQLVAGWCEPRLVKVYPGH
jgi:hypothetical protein